MNIKNDESFTCSICLLDIVEKNNTVLTECGHNFCKICFEQYENKHLLEGTFSKLNCPLCRKPLLKEIKFNQDTQQDFFNACAGRDIKDIVFIIKDGNDIVKINLDELYNLIQPQLPNQSEASEI